MIGKRASAEQGIAFALTHRLEPLLTGARSGHLHLSFIPFHISFIISYLFLQLILLQTAAALPAAVFVRIHLPLPWIGHSTPFTY